MLLFAIAVVAFTTSSWFQLTRVRTRRGLTVGQMIRLLEREPLLASMLAARDRATSGRGGTILVEGEAGIGKTSLLQEFAAQAGDSSRIAWGWCEALVTPRPLGPLQDMGRALDPKIAD